MLDPRARRRLIRHRGAMVGAALMLALVFFAIFGPWLAGRDPYVSDFAGGIDPETGLPKGPGSDFVLGADRLLRDQFARLAIGARLTLVIAVAATAISSLLGGAIGILAGYYEGTPGLRVPWPALAGIAAALVLVLATGGWPAPFAALAAGAALATWAAKREIVWLAAGPRINLDAVLMRLVDVGLCFPFLLLVMAIGAALERTTAVSILAILGLTGWLGTARIFRAKTMQVRRLDYVEASRALGQSTVLILLRHVVPNVANTFIVVSTMAVAHMILAESALSYLGVGLAPPTPTWGRMLFDGQDYFMAAPWLVVGPASAILVAVLAFNLLGEGLRDALDPRKN